MNMFSNLRVVFCLFIRKVSLYQDLNACKVLLEYVDKFGGNIVDKHQFLPLICIKLSTSEKKEISTTALCVNTIGGSPTKSSLIFCINPSPSVS